MTYKLEPTDTPVMNTDHLDNGSVVVNFDLYDVENDEVTKQNGYVQVEIDDNQCYVIHVFDSNGDIINKTVVPFNFKE